MKFFVGDKIELNGAIDEITKITEESIYFGIIRHNKAEMERFAEKGLIKHIKQRMTCKDYCFCWNSVDKDCEIYGEQHLCPRKCPYFLKANSFKNKLKEEECNIQ